MKEDILKIINDFAYLLNSIESEWDSIYKMMNETDLETQDLLYEAELTAFNAAEGYELAKKIQEVRKRRRELKDRQEILRFIKEFHDNNKRLKIPLFKLAQNIENTLKAMETREYKPRIRSDIKLSKRWEQMQQVSTEGGGVA